MPEFNRVLIIGASSGIGKALAEKLLKDGSSIAMVSRRREPMGSIAKPCPNRALVYPHDVTDYAKTEALFQQITLDLGGLDMVIYNSGIMHPMEENEFNFAKDKD